MKDVKKAAVENIANVTEILDCSIASKKVTQCKAIIRPKKEHLRQKLRSILKLLLLKRIYNPNKIEPKNILCQTITSDVLLINSPKIAVKPAIKTKKWR
jgi:hypothetical protein